MNKSERSPSGLVRMPDQDGYYWVLSTGNLWGIAYYKDGDWFLPDIQGPVIKFITLVPV